MDRLIAECMKGLQRQRTLYLTDEDVAALRKIAEKHDMIGIHSKPSLSLLLRAIARGYYVIAENRTIFEGSSFAIMDDEEWSYYRRTGKFPSSAVARCRERWFDGVGGGNTSKFAE